jgi:RHS repeat-associated protein
VSNNLEWKYTYDNANHLTRAQEWKVSPSTLLYEVDYKYDVFGNRVEADVDPEGDGDTDAITRYALDGWQSGRMPAGGTDNAAWNVWAELDGQNSNALLTRYLRGDVVDQIFAREDGSGNAYWTLTDRLGSVRDVTDNTGAVKDTLGYDAYGNITSETASAYRGNYAWTGREFDSTTGLQYNRARYYDPKAGRWQTQDPLGFAAGDSNLYRYVKHEVVNVTDPTGFCLEEQQGPQKGQKLKLTAEDTGPPKAQPNGGFRWILKWKLVGGKSNMQTGGWVVQRLTWTWTVKTIGGTDNRPNYVKKARSPYWEAFQVPPNEVYSQKDDWFLVPGLGGIVTADWTATATYYDKMTLADLQAKGFKLKNEETLAGAKVYATAKDPRLGMGSTNALTRTMSLRFGAKDKSGKTYVLLDAKDYGHNKEKLVSKF